jgi:uncharacterized protein (TIGR03435 family)
MRHHAKSAGRKLDRFFAQAKHPSQEEIDSSRQRVLERLNSDDTLALAELEEARTPKRRLVAVLAAAAVAVATAAAVFLTIDARVDARVTVQAVDGTLHRIFNGEARAIPPGEKVDAGSLLRSDRSTRATLALADGSRVEVRPLSELSVEPVSDGVRIHLSKGGIIVEAAKQRAGHLYVQTQDVTVSVLGTVFLVNAEAEGSRVAVIQGEVHVQHGTALKTLLPGEQVATGPEMPALPVVQEFSWSRKAASHLALLQRSTAQTIPRSAARLEFAATSIRPHSGVSPNGQESLGFVCHGVDGNRAAEGEHIGGQGRIIAPQGRCVGNGVFVEALIAFAYGVPNRNVLGVPEWAAQPNQQAFARLPANAFHIEATADDPSSATTAELIEMVKAMLANRFQLKVRRESREVPGYALVVAKDGHKLKLKDPSDGEQLPSLEIDAHGAPIIHGKSTMQKLAQWLGGAFGFSPIAATVVDKTGLTEVYDYEFDLLPRGGGAGQREGPGLGQAPRPQTAEERDKILIDLLEEQLGLRLVPEKAIPAEVVVIEKLEKPSEN